jgi:hypothetical protein
MEKVMNIIEDATGGESHKSHKYRMDQYGQPSIDYGESDSRTLQWEKTAETDRIKTYVDLTSLCKRLAGTHDQILSYFLDGSRTVFKVDDVAYSHPGGRSVIYPVIAGQIGVGCCKRTNKTISPEQFKNEIVLSLPDIANRNGKLGFFGATTLKIKENFHNRGNFPKHIEFSDILQYKTDNPDKGKFDDRATACVQDRMIECEKKLVAELVRNGKLNQDNYLIKDGSLEYRPTDEDKANSRKYSKFKHNYDWILGASKQFNAEACKDIRGKSNPGFIADLPLYHRTPVACFRTEFLGDIQYAVWYVRLRDKKRTRNPFDGILKIEKILVNDDEIQHGMESDLVDRLSAQIINERNPVCYGSDLRWTNHIYPIYLTERWVKSKYISTESFLQLF